MGAKGPKHCQNIFIVTSFVVEKNRLCVRRLREEREDILQKPAQSELCVISEFVSLGPLTSVCLPCMWLDPDKEALFYSMEPWTRNELFFSPSFLPLPPHPHTSHPPTLSTEAWRQTLPVLFVGVSY